MRGTRTPNKNLFEITILNLHPSTNYLNLRVIDAILQYVSKRNLSNTKNQNSITTMMLLMFL